MCALLSGLYIGADHERGRGEGSNQRRKNCVFNSKLKYMAAVFLFHRFCEHLETAFFPSRGFLVVLKTQSFHILARLYTILIQRLIYMIIMRMCSLLSWGSIRGNWI